MNQYLAMFESFKIKQIKANLHMYQVCLMPIDKIRLKELDIQETQVHSFTNREDRVKSLQLIQTCTPRKFEQFITCKKNMKTS